MIALAGLNWLRVFMAAPVRQVKQAITNTRYGTVWANIRESYRNHGHWLVTFEFEVKTRGTSDLKVGLKSGCLVDEAPRVVSALVNRLVARHGIGTPFAGSEPDGQWRGNLLWLQIWCG